MYITGTPRVGVARPGCLTALAMKRDTSVNLRITSELRAELQQLADADGRKLSGYIVRLLEFTCRRKRRALRRPAKAANDFGGPRSRAPARHSQGAPGNAN